MRKPAITGLILSILIMIPGFALAAEITELNANADCLGWSATATLSFDTGEFMADMDYTVALVAADGTAVEYANWSGTASRMEQAVIIKMYSGDWGVELVDNYTASFVFHLSGVETVYTMDVNCGGVDDGGEDLEPADEPCHLTFKWWKKNPEAWPVQSLILGDSKLSRTELLTLMRGRHRGDLRRNLVRELVAAKLNVANGCDNGIAPDLEAADGFLRDYPLDRSLRGREMRRLRTEIRTLRRPLKTYNRLECADAVLDLSDDEFDGGGFDKSDGSSDTISFESLKALYR